MQFGFAFLEAGSVRAMNTVNILWKNLADFFIGTIVFWAVGFAFAFGDLPQESSYTNANRFIGSGFAFWIFMLSMAISAYIIYTTLITGFIFPVIVHWSWSETGWLRSPKISNFYRHDYLQNGTFFYNQNEPVRFIDFAGSGVVHITGGLAGLIGTWIMGPRHGRFGEENKGMFFGHSVPLINLGFCFLLIGFLCFNGGSELAVVGAGEHGTIVAKCFMNTIIAGSAGGVVALTMNYGSTRMRRGYADISLYYLMNGALAGMVAVAAGSNNLEQGWALFIGSFGALFMMFCKNFLERLEIDDPLTASPIHLGGGLVGILLTPVFKNDGVIELAYIRRFPLRNSNDFQCDYFEWKVLGWNVVGMLAIVAWTSALCSVIFWILKKLNMLRIPASAEKYGLDRLKHGEEAYPLDGYFG
ncbi:unnamed protein product [Oikopleura dioica]|uniref:Ammonium transporter AmtB-like domain-containing protein n=1 Tax=Oikopleura dioica TaxID=34765 RepID=E4YBQ4_OIKDI|nr:unnamed protein product [Oikopleura dioica]